MSLKVIGAGFGRTGTLSLKVALERLGFDKCHHMLEVIQNPRTADAWVAAGRGEPVDWRELMDGYEACVDWPACTFYRELMEVYPEAKVLLSVRDPERWYESVRTTIYRLSNTTPRWLIWLAAPVRAVVSVSQACVWRGFSGRFEEKAHAIAVFNAHIAEVKRTVPADRLLVFEVSQGWGPLCESFGVEVPDEPFPHLNDRAAMLKRLRIMVALRWFGRIVLIVLLLAIAALVRGGCGDRANDRPEPAIDGALAVATSTTSPGLRLSER